MSSKGWFPFDWWNHLHCMLEWVWEVVVEESLQGKGVLSQGSFRWLWNQLGLWFRQFVFLLVA
jgi:hypothetical protein